MGLVPSICWVSRLGLVTPLYARIGRKLIESIVHSTVVRDPSALGITTGSPASRTLTTELVVPRSIPTALAMGVAP